MSTYKETFETWNKIAALYQEKFMRLDIYNASYDLFCAAIKKQKPAILEIGCGPGNITNYLLSKRPDFMTEGIDIAPNMVELARKNNPTADFKVMDCRQLHELTTRYDGIMCGFCLPYLSEEDSLKLVSDCNHLLADDGVLYISFVEGDSNESGFQAGSSGDRTYFYYHKLDNLTRALMDIGFEKPEVVKVNYKKADESTDVHTIILTKKS